MSSKHNEDFEKEVSKILRDRGVKEVELEAVKLLAGILKKSRT
jgi:hypothetical protein